METELKAGVIGVGNIGQHHARIYNQLDEATLIGVTDKDRARAEEIATKYGTKARNTDKLIERADILSVAVPAPIHYDVGVRCIEAGVDVLIEKPFVLNPEAGETLIQKAEKNGVKIQVGHVERFNPVLDTIEEIISGLNVIAVSVNRIGPPPNQAIDETAVTDLMIHDLDILRSFFGDDISSISGAGGKNGRYATAILNYTEGPTANLTASQVTQKKVRNFTITAEECYVVADYINQSIDIYRRSAPEFITTDGEMHYRTENVVEKPVVANGEPLRRELQSFIQAVSENRPPRVTGRDGIEAIKITQKINQISFD